MPPKKALGKVAPAPFPLASLESPPMSPAKRKRPGGRATKVAAPAKSRPPGAVPTQSELTRRPKLVSQPAPSLSRTPSPSDSSRQTPVTSPTLSPRNSPFGPNALAGSSKTLVPSQELPRFKLGSEASDDDDDHLKDGGFDLAVHAAKQDNSPMKKRLDALETATKARAEQMLEDAGLGATRAKKVWRPSKLPVGVEVGSACLVRSTNNHYLYGRLLGFEPAEQQGGVDHYVVETIERSAKVKKPLKLRRGRIIFTCDNEVATCKIMETKANVPTFACDANIRPLTPPPEATPIAPSRERGRAKPTTADPPKYKEQSFSELSQREQLYRIRPHLQRIIKDLYPPAMPRLDLFYAGRYDAVRKLAKYGDIRENEAINVFGAEIRRWALRAERWGSEGKPSGVEDEPARPTGSARYEKLSPQQRQMFIIDVLVPEAIAQICILAYELSEEHSDEQTIYEAAMKSLDSLTTEDPVVKWQMVADAVYSARRQQRRMQGLKEENESEHEKWQREHQEFNEKVERGDITISGASGAVRVRKRASYR